MNRERGLRGVNSYARELGFDPLTRLTAGDAWLDLCCGSGRALIEASGDPRARDLHITGVDLVDFFVPAVRSAGLDLIAADVVTWSPPRAYDLITCVHGLHYVGDKLGLLARIASWLTPAGRFVADLDPVQIDAPGPVTSELRRAGFEFDTARRRIALRGGRDIAFPYTYLGADDTTGPNYTGQPAVRSYYTQA
ncbi:methyltransferase domain-containing protein [Streptomyces sp. SID3343]|uniref:class I SAM-dependent methyltransferase n=1 Tax=Streptomyces sp. SID3343 TaxID=2690260 RepID=UPI00136B466F|nr:methyltransferase domain-containing protein [Streptomyces sp. SID3343]MYV97061.1 methyltransferase domain-containing protein [Streptomyces sp. SID3343]